MKISLLREARDDLLAGQRFYESRAPGLGRYFLEHLIADLDELGATAGVHRRVFGVHRALSRRFPFAIYYVVDHEMVKVLAVLDCRRNPTWIRSALRSR